MSKKDKDLIGGGVRILRPDPDGGSYHRGRG